VDEDKDLADAERMWILLCSSVQESTVGYLDAKQCLPAVRKHSRHNVCKQRLPTMFVGVYEPI
jgi:hypothetical protein